MATAKKTAAKKAPAKKASTPTTAPAGTLTRTAKPKPAVGPDVKAPAKKKAASKRDPSLGPVVIGEDAPKARAGSSPRSSPSGRAPSTAGRAPVHKTRVVIPMEYYEGYKDDIKAPIKALGMKWNFLGDGKGLYKRERAAGSAEDQAASPQRRGADVHCFTQFLDDGVHYSVWGDDKKAVDELLGAWRKLAGEVTWAQWLAAGVGANVAEQGAKESEATKLWKLQEPHRRPGEPDLFYHKRVAEWQAKKPA